MWSKRGVRWVSASRLRRRRTFYCNFYLPSSEHFYFLDFHVHVCFYFASPRAFIEELYKFERSNARHHKKTKQKKSAENVKSITCGKWGGFSAGNQARTINHPWNWHIGNWSRPGLFAFDYFQSSCGSMAIATEKKRCKGCLCCCWQLIQWDFRSFPRRSIQHMSELFFRQTPTNHSIIFNATALIWSHYIHNQFTLFTVMAWRSEFLWLSAWIHCEEHYPQMRLDVFKAWWMGSDGNKDTSTGWSIKMRPWMTLECLFPFAGLVNFLYCRWNGMKCCHCERQSSIKKPSRVVQIFDRQLP